jgi:hypothetical protein
MFAGTWKKINEKNLQCTSVSVTFDKFAALQ